MNDPKAAKRPPRRRVVLATGFAGMALLLAAVLAVLRPGTQPSSAERVTRSAIDRGNELVRTGRPRQALAAVALVAADDRLFAEALAVRGLAHAALRETETSRLLLERSLALRPAQPMILKVLAAIYLSRSEPKRAIACLEQAARLDPGDFRPWYAMGEALLLVHKPDQAAGAFREALARQADNVEARIGLLSAEIQVAPPESLTELMPPLLEARPNDGRVRLLAARLAQSLGRRDEALHQAEKTVEIDPESVDGHLLLAQLRFMSGDPRAALADVEQAIGRDPHNVPGLNLLAQIQSALGQPERARDANRLHAEAVRLRERLQDLTDQIERHPDDPEPRWRLGQIAAGASLRPLAIQSYRAAIALDPNCRPALDGLQALGVPVVESAATDGRVGG